MGLSCVSFCPRRVHGVVNPKAQTGSRKKLALIEEDSTSQSLFSELLGCGNESAELVNYSYECHSRKLTAAKRLQFGSPHVICCHSTSSLRCGRFSCLPQLSCDTSSRVSASSRSLWQQPRCQESFDRRRVCGPNMSSSRVVVVLFWPPHALHYC